MPKLIDTLLFETHSFKIVHFYDISNSTYSNRSKVYNEFGNPFIDSNNSFARILLVNKLSKDTLFNIPSGVFTHINIDTINKVVIGLSRIMVLNPYKIVLIDYFGKILFKRNICVIENKLSRKELLTFKNKFTKIYNEFKEKDLISFERGFYYICKSGHSLIGNDTNAKKFLMKKERLVFNNKFKNITSDGHGFALYQCFSLKDPFYKIEIKNGELVCLYLRDYNENVVCLNLFRNLP